MDENYISLEELDKEKVKTAVRLHAPIEITSYTLPRQMEQYMHDVLTLFLSSCHQEHMNECLNFCLGELLSNSKKANTKRIYFREKNLDINNPSDYEEGMKHCREDTEANMTYYLTEQKKAGLYIKLLMQLEDNYIRIEIKNNSVLCPTERERINNKLENVKQYNNASDVFAKVLDQSEGAGLGIIIIILMLQKIGLSKENFKIISTDKETITRIDLPLNKQVQEEVVKLYSDFVEMQKTIPVFESQFNQITDLINRPRASKKKILKLISNDATLAALLVKNACIIDSSCMSIEKAYDILGLEKLKEIFTKDNAEVNIVEDEIDNAKLWEHSQNVAFIAYNLAQNIALDEGITAEDIYFAGLFHDIESLLIEAISNSQKETFLKHYREIGISHAVLKMIYTNSWHSMGGYLIAQKWNLNPKFASIIQNYKNPSDAPEEIKKSAQIINLADLMQYYDAGKVEYYQLDSNLLSSIGIDSESKLKKLIETIKAAM